MTHRQEIEDSLASWDYIVLNQPPTEYRTNYLYREQSEKNKSAHNDITHTNSSDTSYIKKILLLITIIIICDILFIK